MNPSPSLKLWIIVVDAEQIREVKKITNRYFQEASLQKYSRSAMSGTERWQEYIQAKMLGNEKEEKIECQLCQSK